MKHKQNSLATAIRYALGAGVVAGLAVTAAPVVAQEAADETADRIQVTGTRILREDDGPAPITVIGRDVIDGAGDVSVAEFLNRQTFNTFGSFTPASGFAGGAQGQANLSLRALGSGRTLVLVDGRRISNTPAFAGAAQNLNSIPLAAVERIEILRDGASAIYGTDAIGGVVNIITRQRFDGLEISGQIDRPTQDGGDGHQYSAVFGVSGDRGGLMVSAEHFERDIIFRRDRDYLFAQEPSPLGGPGSYYRVGDRSQGAFGGGLIPSPNIPGAIVEPFANCPSAFDGAEFPSSARANFPLLTTEDVLCLYRFTDDAGQTAAVNRDTVSVSGDYEVTPGLDAFMRFTSTRAESFGRFAAAPVTPVFGGLSMGADNQFNPTQGEPDGPHDIILLFRPVAGGPRDSTVEDNVNEFLVGLRGELDIAGSASWELAAFHNRYTQSDIGINYGLRPELQNLVDREILNPFDPDPETFSGFAHTILSNNEFRASGFDGQLSFDDVLGNQSFRLPLVIGAEYRDEKFFSLVDQQSEAGNVFGSAGSTAGGERDYWAVYAETLLPLLDDRLELSLALRYDDYSDFGGELSPRVALAYRPMDNLMFRASYSEGFAAPDLEVLNRQPSQSFPPGLIDRLGCQIDPDNTFACVGRQRETFFTNNPNLGPEQSENWTVGVVFEPIDGFRVGVDYFNIELTDGIGNLTAQNVLDNEQRCFNEGRACDPTQEGQVIRTAPVDQGGQVLEIVAPAANFSVVKTDGLDVDLNWTRSTDVGQFGVNLVGTYTFSYERATAPMAPLEEVTRSVGSPKWRGQLRGTWTMAEYGVSALLNHIPSTRDCTIAKLNSSSPGDIADCERHMASFTTLDLQASYTAPWGGEFTLGARNLFDRDPPLSIEFGTPAAPQPDQGLYSIFGRVPFLRYSQSF